MNLKKMIKAIGIFIILLFFSQCGEIKDGLTLKKGNKVEEFLIEKKNPLIVPPDFGDLPTPENILNNESVKKNDEVQILLDEEVSDGTSENKPTSTSSSIESSILKKIENK